MDGLFSAERFLALLGEMRVWLLENVLAPDNVVQLAVIALALGLAALLRRRLGGFVARYEPPAQIRRLAGIATELALPLIWLALLALAISAASLVDRPDRLIRIAATLIMAWVAIHIAAQLVTNPLWAKLISWTAWIIAALNILGLLDPTIGLLNSVGLDVGEIRISLYTVLRAMIVLVVLLSVAFYVTGLIEARIRTSRALSPSVQVLFTKSLKIVLVGLAVLIALQGVGVDLTGLAVLGGAFGLGAGFGLQKIVSNLISGVILLVDKSIKPGDVIAVSGTYGWVTALGGRYVSVVTRDGVEHLIPNETLISERVENWTHTHSRTRLKLDVGVHYQ